MTKQVKILALAGLLILFVGFGYWLYFAGSTPFRIDEPDRLGYVVSDDARIHVIDLEKQSVVRVSEPIPSIGRPTAIDVDWRTSTLYVASERAKNQNDYLPLVAVDLSDQSFSLIRKYDFNGGVSRKVDQSQVNSSVRAAYKVVVGPHSDELYVNRPSSDGNVTTVLDPTTGSVLRKMPTSVQRKDSISPDGEHIAEIWPSGERELPNSEPGEKRVWKGGVAVRNIKTGEIVEEQELIMNKGLSASWDDATKPFVDFRYVDRTFVLYDRVSGGVIAQISPEPMTGLKLASVEVDVDTINDCLGMSMFDTRNQGYVVFVCLEDPMSFNKVPLSGIPTNFVARVSD